MSFEVMLCIERELWFLLSGKGRIREGCVSVLRQAPMKDLLESLGIPHTEVGGMTRRGQPVGFGYVPEAGEMIRVLAPGVPVDVTRPGPLRPVPLAEVRFLVDVNVERLGRLLRLAGFDVAPSGGEADRQLVSRARHGGRVVLTRDRFLLMRKSVVWGHLIRSDRPWCQLAEVVSFFGLRSHLAPFTRCPVCNGILQDVPAEVVWEGLEPLTRRYYRVFRRCPDCGKVYWAGSHHDRILERLERFCGETPPEDI